MARTANRGLANRTHPEYKIVQLNGTNFFPSVARQVRMSGCRIQPQDTSDLTSDAHGINRVSHWFKSNPSIFDSFFSPTRIETTRLRTTTKTTKTLEFGFESGSLSCKRSSFSNCLTGKNDKSWTFFFFFFFFFERNASFYCFLIFSEMMRVLLRNSSL